MLLLSATRLATFQACHRKYFYTYVMGIVPAARALPLEFGSAWGKAMDVWHMGGTLDAAMAAFCQAYPEPSETTVRTQMVGKHLLQQYAQRWPRPELFAVQATERWIEAPLNEGVWWCGKLDKLVEEEGQRYPLEHKTTTSYLTSYTLRRYNPSLQTVGYAFLGSMVGAQPRIVYDLTHISRTEPRQGERFFRYEVSVQPWQIDEFRRLVQQEATNLTLLLPYATPAEETAWTPNWNACQMYGGCPYLPLCTAPPTTRARIMEMDYTPRPAHVDMEATNNDA